MIDTFFLFVMVGVLLGVLIGYALLQITPVFAHGLSEGEARIVDFFESLSAKESAWLLVGCVILLILCGVGAHLLKKSEDQEIKKRSK